MFTDEFRRMVEGGKYTQWANSLSPNQLLGLFWALGEYGYRWGSQDEARQLLEQWMAESDIHPRARVGLLMAMDCASGKHHMQNEVINAIQDVMRHP
jgi:hypothetical protein